MRNVRCHACDERTAGHTDGQWKVEQYSVGAESAKFLDICVYRKGNSQTLFPCFSGKHSGADRSVYSKLPCLLNIYKLLTHVLVHALLPGDSFLEYIYSIEVCGQ